MGTYAGYYVITNPVENNQDHIWFLKMYIINIEGITYQEDTYTVLERYLDKNQCEKSKWKYDVRIMSMVEAYKHLNKGKLARCLTHF